MANTQKLIVLSSDDRLSGELAGSTIRVDARLQAYLGGARSSLGVRTARAVLQALADQPITVDSFRSAMEALVARHGLVQLYDREPMTNDQIAHFISLELAQAPSASSTRLLEKLRTSGRACERKRFHGIFMAVKERRSAPLFALEKEGA
jgi:hypothetical protein